MVDFIALPLELLKSRMAWGRNDFFSLSVEQDNDSSLSLKLLLCLEMALCSGWCGLSMMDSSLFRVRLSAIDVRLSSSVPTTVPAFLTSLFRRPLHVVKYKKTITRKNKNSCWTSPHKKNPKH